VAKSIATFVDQREKMGNRSVRHTFSIRKDW